MSAHAVSPALPATDGRHVYVVQNVTAALGAHYVLTVSTVCIANVVRGVSIAPK